VGTVIRGALITGCLQHPSGSRPGTSMPELIAREPVDVRTEGDRIVEIGARVRACSSDEIVDALGGELIPGLHDHHVHMRAWAAAESSVVVGPPAVRSASELADRLHGAEHGPTGRKRGEADEITTSSASSRHRSSSGAAGAKKPGHRSCPTGTAPGDAWVRAIGYHESVAGPLNRWSLDRLAPDRPVRLQHRSGALWILNSAALRALGLDTSQASGQTTDHSPAVSDRFPSGVERTHDGQLTGRIWRADAWLRRRLSAIGIGSSLSLGALSARLVAMGVTGLTDATPDQSDSSLAGLADARSNGVVLQRLHLMVAPRTAASPDTELAPAVTTGPVKYLLDDQTLPPLHDLADMVRCAHEAGRPVAVHCVTHTQTVLTVAAFQDAGTHAGDRIEHGAMVSPDLFRPLSSLGVTIVTQPAMATARGDQYLHEVEQGDIADLWRIRSLVDAGISVAAGTDAPFGPGNPWAAVAAAANRLTPSGQPLGFAERVNAYSALRLFFGHACRPGVARSVAVGQPADLVVLACPLSEALATARSGGTPAVQCTVVAGKVAYRSRA